MLWWVLQGAANYALLAGIGGLVVSSWLEKRWGMKATAPLHWTFTAILALGPALGLAALWVAPLDGEVRGVVSSGRTRSILVLAHGSEQRVRIDSEHVSRCPEGDRVVKPSGSFALSCEGQPVDLDIDQRLLIAGCSLLAAAMVSAPRLRRRPATGGGS